MHVPVPPHMRMRSQVPRQVPSHMRPRVLPCSYTGLFKACHVENVSSLALLEDVHRPPKPRSPHTYRRARRSSSGSTELWEPSRITSLAPPEAGLKPPGSRG